MEYQILEEILILLLVAVLAVSLFHRLRLPPVLAYFSVGVLVGPYGGGWIADSEDIHFLAEFGVVFLLFTVGLEFSFSHLVAMRREVLGLGGAQVLVTTVLAGLGALAMGVDPGGAVVVGGVLALSSTAIVVKQLAEQVELGSRHGRVAVGILLFQDVSVVPFLIVIPALAAGSEASITAELLLTLGKGVAVVAAMLAAGHWLLRPLFHEIAASRSAELFTLTALLFTLAAAWVTEFAGLSLALGAFLAGMMLGETEFRHQVESDIRPFRDVLLGLFFITVGMLLDLKTLMPLLPHVLSLTAALMLGKALLIFILGRLMGVEAGVAVRTGVVLAQGGEFGFALISLALGAGVLDTHTTNLLLGALILSMALTPLLIRYNGIIAKRLCGQGYLGQRESLVQELRAEAEALRDHTLLCGYGRIGQNLARFLDQEQLPYLALDLDPERVREARLAGERVNYGDATRIEILQAAGLERARVLVVTFADVRGALKILPQARRLRPDIPLLVRAQDDSHLDQLLAAGATEVIPETFEASVMIASHLLYLLDVPVTRIARRVQEVHEQRFQMLREIFHGQEVDFTGWRRGGQLATVVLDRGFRAVGRRLGEFDLAKLGVEIKAVRRGGIRGERPDAELVFKAGDVLVLYGPPEGIKGVRRLLQQEERQEDSRRGEDAPPDPSGKRPGDGSDSGV